MIRQIARRSVAGVGIVLFVVTLTFLLINLAPGDPTRLWVGPSAGEAELEAARQALGLDRPLTIQYLNWLKNFVTGNWGMSLTQQRPVTMLLWGALPYTLLLSISSLILTYLIGVLIGVIQAIRRNSAIDTGLTVASLVVFGMPAYWLAIMLVLVFSYASARFGWPDWMRLPAMGVSSLDADFLSPWDQLLDRIRHLILPLVTLGAIGAAGTARFVRASVLEVRNQAYVRAALAKGLPRLLIEVKHILRNALLPVITLLGMSLPALFSGTVFVEVIFAWPGMGRVLVEAVGGRDYPVVLAGTAIFAMLVVVGNLLADIMYGIADPRIREGGSRGHA